jgi:cellulose synthase/poly-beta-1,6-N-acetylglucosamine synthase-like glycosyltransferase
MSIVFTILLWGVVLAVSLPVVLFAVETFAAFFPLRRQPAGAPPSSLAVIVPAHNEGRHMAATLRDLHAQLRPDDRLIVVADNCTDDTADVAQECGAEVFVRVAPDHRGKGYALQYAVDCLRDAPPQCILFFDADCRVEEGVLHHLAGVAWATGRPAQALYTMNAPDGAGPGTGVSAFAWIMINRVRMTGLSNIIGATRFTGAGLAAPWGLISRLDFGAGDITEDLVMTLKMALAGAAPVFVPDAQVTSLFPTAEDASVTQRARWEHGSLEIMARRAAPALLRGILRADMRLVMLAADAMIPPLVALGAGLILTAVLSALALGFAGPGPLVAILTSITLFAVALVAGWLGFGRAVLPPSQLWALAPFMLQKLNVYGRRGRASTKTWTRTKRGDDGGEMR